MPENKQIFKMSPVGDSALVVQLGESIDLSTNQRVHALAALLMQNAPQGMGEAVPAYTTVLLNYDPLQITYDAVQIWVRGCYQGLTTYQESAGRLVEIPTVYGGKYGPDLADVAAHTGLTEEAVIKLHSAVDYPGYMMGFTPGFPYRGGVDKKLATPGLETPRTLVKAGSVGIAGEQTGIYSVNSPGGWRLIGFTPLMLFDPEGETPFLLQPGDRLRFVPVSEKEAGL